MQDVDERPEKPAKKTKRNILKVLLFIFLLILLFIFLGIGILFYKYPPLAKTLYNFVTAPVSQIASDGQKVNILVMGKSGEDHDGADLTDTMILTSVFLENPAIKTVSIPRDIWIPELRAKINSAYYWGKTGTPFFDSGANGSGIGLAKKITKEVTGQDIQYGVVIDFSSFKEIIDTLGGIEVNVGSAFTDKFYPIAGRENDACGGDKTFACRYETITFNSGLQTMNGETALKFVRSRHAEGIEGTDTAREARQQKVIDAIKKKITDPKVYLSLKIDLSLLNIVNKYVETDIDLPTAGILARKALDGSKNVSQNLLPEDLLINPPINETYDNLYVFIPKAGNGRWGEIQNWFRTILKN